MRSGLSAEVRAHVTPLEIVKTAMQCSNHPMQEIRPMTPMFRSRKPLSRRLFSLAISGIALIAGLSACACVTAQQADAGHSGPAVLAEATAAIPAPGSPGRR